MYYVTTAHSLQVEKKDENGKVIEDPRRVLEKDELEQLISLV